MARDLAHVLPPVAVQSIRRALLRWYDRHRRELPWRRTVPDAYATLVSEFMLQQTQVSTVVPYFERFMSRFPTVRDLAAAELDEVLPYWAGLGYYRRCHNLHAAARAIVRDHGGAFPRQADCLRALPGIGRYTAGAIASIAFGQRTPAVDANVTRVLSRLAGLDLPGRGDDRNRAVWAAAERLTPRARPGDFNQALMELGATTCMPRQPACHACPLRRWCRTGLTDQAPLPAATRRAPVKDEVMVSLAVIAGGRVLLTRRPDRGLWAGLWELPSGSPVSGEGMDATAWRIWREHARGRFPGVARYATLVHRLTHRTYTFEAYVAATSRVPELRPVGQSVRWIAVHDESDLAKSAATRKLLAALPPEVRS